MFETLVSYWWIVALMVGLTKLAYQGVNEVMKIEGKYLVFWRGLIPAAFLTPLLFVVPTPTDPVFYLSVGVTACFAQFIDMRLFNVVNLYGTGIYTRLSSLTPVLTFFIWFALRPSDIHIYFATPYLSLGILGCLVLMGSMLFMLKKQPINREALIHLLPVFVGSSIIAIFNKNAMDHAPLQSAIVWYIVLQGYAVATISFVKIKRHATARIQRFFDRDVLKAGILIGLAFVIYLALKNLAMGLTDHPAYVSMLERSSALWILMIYHLVGRKEDEPIWYGLMMVFAAVAMIYLQSKI